MYLAYLVLMAVITGGSFLLMAIGVPRSIAMITGVVLMLVLARMLQRLDKTPDSF
jgi:membrane protein implicated in regulation of membrane protease activity